MRLRAVAPLGPYEIHVGALTKHHVDQLICVAFKRNTLTGRLMHVPTESVIKPKLVLQLGLFAVALHPTDTVMVVPPTHHATVVIEARKETDGTSIQDSS